MNYALLTVTLGTFTKLYVSSLITYGLLRGTDYKAEQQCPRNCHLKLSYGTNHKSSGQSILVNLQILIVLKQISKVLFTIRIFFCDLIKRRTSPMWYGTNLVYTKSVLLFIISFWCTSRKLRSLLSPFYYCCLCNKFKVSKR